MLKKSSPFGAGMVVPLLTAGSGTGVTSFEITEGEDDDDDDGTSDSYPWITTSLTGIVSMHPEQPVHPDPQPEFVTNPE